MKLKSVYKLITEGNININFGVFYNFFKSPEVKEKILSTRINEIPNLFHPGSRSDYQNKALYPRTYFIIPMMNRSRSHYEC